MDYITQVLLNEEAALVQRLHEVRTELLRRGHNTGQLTISIDSSINQPEIDVIDRGFPASGGILEQAVYVIKSKNRFLYNDEISQEIFKYRKKAVRDINWLKKRISSVLSTARSKGELENLIVIKMGAGVQTNVWGSRSWLEDDGKTIKPEFSPILKDRTSQEKIVF